MTEIFMEVLRERMLAKVLVDDATGCWVFTGYRAKDGYGRIGVPRQRRVALAHRVSYEVFVGDISEGLEIDHLCRNRGCVNPLHLEPVTRQENIRRGYRHGDGPTPVGECWRGHTYTPENTYVAPNGSQFCRECRRLAARRYEATRPPRNEYQRRRRAEKREAA